MRRILLLSLVLLGVGLPAISSIAPAQAGSGSANSCTDGSANAGSTTEYPILTTPITLALQVNNKQSWYPNEPVYRLCYSSSPAGYSGNDTVGGSIDVFRPDQPYTEYTGQNVECRPQSNTSTVSPSCYVGIEEYWGYRTGDESVTASIPITFCSPGCVDASQDVGWTGITVDWGDVNDATYTLDGNPPGTATGVGTTVPTTVLCIDGACQTLVSRQDIGVGVNMSAVDVIPFLCYIECVYGGVSVKNDRPIAAVQVGSTVIPVTSPTGACVNAWDVVYPGLYCR